MWDLPWVIDTLTKPDKKKEKKTGVMTRAEGLMCVILHICKAKFAKFGAERHRMQCYKTKGIEGVFLKQDCVFSNV